MERMLVKTDLMRRTALIAALGLWSSAAYAQAPAASNVLGQVEALDASARTLTLKTGEGTMVSIALAEKATIVKVAPGEKSLQNAAPITFEIIGPGDRILVSGGVRSEGRVEGALRVIVMAKTDLVARDADEQRAWRERAVVGTVTAVDASKSEFTLKVSATASAPSAAGRRPGPAEAAANPPPPAAPPDLIVDASKATLHRYSDTSARYDDARPATVADIDEGDQLRLLGTKSADGTRMTADRVVFGSFKTRALAIEHVDTVNNTIAVKDLESNEKFTIAMVKGGTIRKIPAEMAPMLTMMSGGAGGGRPGGFRPGGGAPGTTEGARSAGGGDRAARDGGAAHAGGMGGPGQAGGPRGGRGMADMVERMPAITFADLKKDDWVGAVVGKVDPTGQAIAFNMLAGIEIFASRANRGGGVEVGMPAGLLDGGIDVP